MGGSDADDVVWVLFQLRQSIVLALANVPLVPSFLRGRVLRGARVHVGKGVLVYGGQWVQGRARLHLGAGVFVNYGCYFDTVADIVIEDGVFMADHVRVLTSTHAIGPSWHRAGPLSALPVHIGRGTWIGSGAVIMPGVRVGAGCIIGAHSLVTKDCEPDTVYVGSPAMPRRRLDP